MANSSMLVLPRITTPASRSRRGHRRVVRREPALEDLRAGRGGHVRGDEHVLQRQRDAGQRAELLARRRGGRPRRGPRPAPLGRRRAGRRAPRRRRRRSGPGGPGSPRRPRRSRRDSSAAELGCGHPREIVSSSGSSSSRIRGTRNRCCSTAGAPARAPRPGQAGARLVRAVDVGQRQRRARSAGCPRRRPPGPGRPRDDRVQLRARGDPDPRHSGQASTAGPDGRPRRG